MLNLYNTKTSQKEIFSAIDKSAVRLYVCGPTVYDNIHIGNARPLITYDLLFRILRDLYGAENVIYIRNITDIDDKINARAQKEFPDLPINLAIRELTEKTNQDFQNDAKYLNCLLPSKQPRASDYLDEMRLLINRLLDLGHAYIEQNHVLFSVASMENDFPYGQLSKKPLSEMRSGARVEVADYKRDALDFVLWKPSNEREPGWDSPGNISVKGRPGWHIECSAMSMKELLTPFGGGFDSPPGKNVFDIHAGGIDLLFPHHENEIAQSCCALKTKNLANYWLHNGFLLNNDQKMSKSLNNFLTIKDFLNFQLELPGDKKISKEEKYIWIGLVIRLAMFQTHYRSPLKWTEERFLSANSELYRWYRCLFKSSCFENKEISDLSELKDALNDDLNTPLALSKLREFYTNKNYQALKDGLKFIGLLPQDEYLFHLEKMFKFSALSDSEILEKIRIRSKYLEDKNWSEADKIRDELLKAGIQLQDVKDVQTKKKITHWFYL